MKSSRTIETKNGLISITESEGRGPPVLLIHGNSSCKEVFRNQLESEIGKKYRLIAMDLPGHGESADAQDPKNNYTIPGYAKTAIALLDNLGVEKCTVLGWSLGGHIGIEMMACSTIVNGLIISGTPPVGKSEEQMAAGFLPSEHMGLTGQEIFSEQEARDYARSTCGTNTALEPFLLDAVIRTDGRARTAMIMGFANGLGADQRNAVETIEIPLAIANGVDEPFVNNDFVRNINYANLWERRLHIIDGAGHAPFWEKPKEFNKVFSRFLADVNNP